MNLLINKNDLIEHCGLSGNTDDAKVNISIQQAHNKLQSILCRDFYNELKTEFLDGSLSTENQTFVDDYVKSFLVWEAYASFCIVGTFAQTKAGFREHTDENSSPVDNQRIDMIRNNAKEQSMFWHGEMMHFLVENIDNYATYKNSDCYDCREKKLPSFGISGAGKKKKEYYPTYLNDNCCE
jgi:hypothetical protein